MTAHNFDAFLSYAREDERDAQRLFEQLRSAGISVWYDKESLAPGQRWQVAVENAIRKSRFFLALLSSRSEGKRGFVQKEIRRALEILDEFPDDDTYLIPLRLDECRPSHARLADLHWTDLFPWDGGVEKLLRVLDHWKGERSSQTVVRSDGLYASDKGDYTRYLRFFPDGVVVSVSSTGTPADLADWFGSDWNSRGNYVIGGSDLRFADISPEGRVDYEGTIYGDRLVLRSHSHINGYRDVSEFSFIPVENMKP